MKLMLFNRFFAVLFLFISVLNVVSKNKPENKLTTQQWQDDINYLLEEMPKIHKNPYHSTTKENFEIFADKLMARIPKLSDNGIITEIAQLTAMIGDGHTAINIFGFHDNTVQSVINLHIFPVRMYIFPEGVYVTGAAPQYNSLKGSRILKINGNDINDVIEKVKPIVHRDNEYSLKFNLPLYLVIPEFMNGLGIINDFNNMELTVSNSEGKEETVQINSIEMKDMQHGNESSDDNGLPLYMRNDSKNYWYEYLAGNKTLYINYKRVLIDPDDSLKNFCKRIDEFANSNDIERTVIDIRNNGGGDNTTCQPFVDMISRNQKINRKGRLFVIIGRQTFSAASYLTTKLEFNTKAIFAGEPTGATPNHFGDNRPVVLPNSKLEIRLSSLYWQNSFPDDTRDATYPEIAVEISANDYFSGKDPVLEKILSFQPNETKYTEFDRKIIGSYRYSPLQSLDIKSEGNDLKMVVMQTDIAGRNVSFISTSLYPLTSGGFATDINGLHISLNNEGVKLNFHGKEYFLGRLNEEFKTPAELLSEGKNDEAVEIIRKAKEQNPSYSGVSEQVINALGYSALRNKNYDGAIAVFKLNCDLYPDSFNTFDSLAEAYMMTGTVCWR